MDKPMVKTNTDEPQQQLGNTCGTIVAGGVNIVDQAHLWMHISGMWMRGKITFCKIYIAKPFVGVSPVGVNSAAKQEARNVHCTL